jgi:hypothetical protein
MPNNPNAVANLKPFKKGDPRINRKGRPKTFDALRALTQQIVHETAVKDGKPAVYDDGVNPPHVMTNVEAIIRKWLGSGNPQLQRAAIEIAFGKVPENLNISSDKPLELKIVEVVKDAGDDE